MTQEEKQLLLKDLCARLPYGVKVINTAEKVNEVGELDSIMTSRKYKDKLFVGVTLPDDSIMVGIEMIKPYLRSMSSMTDEEKEVVCSMNAISETELNDRLNYQKMYVQNYTIETFDLFNKHHLDYRGLIPMGLALEAPEDMYK